MVYTLFSESIPLIKEVELGDLEMEEAAVQLGDVGAVPEVGMDFLVDGGAQVGIVEGSSYGGALLSGIGSAMEVLGPIGGLAGVVMLLAQVKPDAVAQERIAKLRHSDLVGEDTLGGGDWLVQPNGGECLGSKQTLGGRSGQTEGRPRQRHPKLH